jgi:hypothetical protein
MGSHQAKYIFILFFELLFKKIYFFFMRLLINPIINIFENLLITLNINLSIIHKCIKDGVNW